MQVITEPSESPSAIRVERSAIFVSLELSKSTWLVTSMLPDSEKLSRHDIEGGDLAGLLALIARLRAKAMPAKRGKLQVISIQEAGLDGFWIHRALMNEGIESHIVESASIAMSRRSRRVKTDRVDGEVLLRTLLAWKRGEPRVCSMVVAPTCEEEDRRRITRERKSLVGERTTHINRIKGLLFVVGIRDYNPMRLDRRRRLDTLVCGDGSPLPSNLKERIARELGRLELVIEQIAAVEKERDAMVASECERSAIAPAAMLGQLRGISNDFAGMLWTEGLYRHFANRRQLAAYAGLAPTPWQSGNVRYDQGMSKSGNKRLRTAMVLCSWLWLRHQPGSALSQWYDERVKAGAGKKKTIVALARKLLVAFWKYVTSGVVIEGAIMKA